MAATRFPVVVAANGKLTPAQTCTTADCKSPRIRMNALKCAKHELVYRAAAKARAADRKSAAAPAAAKAAKTRRVNPRAAARSALARNAPANVAANGLRTTRPPRPAAAAPSLVTALVTVE